ncbi:hypothetical protein AGR1B_pTi0163 [Agrobacterium fabacearum S56]|nr:hypothetical protein AGR1B_pTi0163 [Agrobacterium fabacearum S56]
MQATSSYYHYIDLTHFVTIGHCCFIPAHTQMCVLDQALQQGGESHCPPRLGCLFQPVILKESFADRDYFNTERVSPGWRQEGIAADLHVRETCVLKRSIRKESNISIQVIFFIVCNLTDLVLPPPHSFFC